MSIAAVFEFRRKFDRAPPLLFGFFLATQTGQQDDPIIPIDGMGGICRDGQVDGGQSARIG